MIRKEQQSERLIDDCTGNCTSRSFFCCLFTEVLLQFAETWSGNWQYSVVVENHHQGGHRKLRRRSFSLAGGCFAQINPVGEVSARRENCGGERVSGMGLCACGGTPECAFLPYYYIFSLSLSLYLICYFHYVNNTQNNWIFSFDVK